MLICAYGPEGLLRVARAGHPVVPGVEYIVSWQIPGGCDIGPGPGGAIPEPLRRPDFRIFPTLSRGLSRNRNLALGHASAPLCLLADDDLAYTAPGLLGVIDIFRRNPDTDIAAFRFEGGDGKRYPSFSFDLRNPPRGYYISSVELAFRLAPVRHAAIPFDERFGIGAPFPSGEEDVWIGSLLRSGLRGRFFPHTVARHEGDTTGVRNGGDPLFIATKGAVFRLLFPRTWPLRMATHTLRAAVAAPRSALPMLRSWLRGARRIAHLAAPQAGDSPFSPASRRIRAAENIADIPAEGVSVPAVSFIMPLYNAGAYLEEAIRSVQAQTVADWELVIADDGSDDGSADTARAFAATDPRIRVISSTRNSGRAFIPRRLAAEASLAPIVSPLDADDTISPDYLEKLLATMRETGASLVYPTMEIPQKDGTLRLIPDTSFDISHPFAGQDLVKETLDGWRISANGGIIGKELYLDSIRRMGLTNYIYSDETLTRLLLIGCGTAAISAARYRYRPTEGSVTRRVSSRFFDFLEADIALSRIVTDTYPPGSEERIKMESQRFFNIVEALRRYSRHAAAMHPRARRKTWLRIRHSYSLIAWETLRPAAGWKYYSLMRMGPGAARIFMKIYDRFAEKRQ